MSTTPPLNQPSFRIAWESQIANLPPEHQTVIRSQMNAFTDIYQAITALNTKVEGVKSTANATAATVENTNTASETIIQQIASVIGFVNNQTGITAYTTLPSDYGALVVLNDASAIAVTLNTLGSGGGIVLPWYAFFLNLGSGTATLTPASGTISYPGNLSAASMPITSGQIGMVWFDGTNFYADALSVSGGGGGVTSLNSLTGALSLTSTGSTVTITPSGSTIDLEVSGGYSLGGTLSNANIVAGPGAGTGAMVSVVGQDGNHTVEVITGTTPTANATIFTVTFTASRGRTTSPVLFMNGSVGYTSIAQFVGVTGSATSYTVISGNTALAAPVSYVWNVSCP